MRFILLVFVVFLNSSLIQVAEARGFSETQSDTFNYKQFKGKSDLCVDIILRTLKRPEVGLPSLRREDMNISRDRNQVIAEGELEYPETAAFPTKTRYKLKCNSDGKIEITAWCKVDMNFREFCSTERVLRRIKIVNSFIEGGWYSYQDDENVRKGIFPLYLHVKPDDATVKILNIKQKFKFGMYLKGGRYSFIVSRPGYIEKRFYIILNAENFRKGISYNVELTPGDESSVAAVVETGIHSLILNLEVYYAEHSEYPSEIAELPDYVSDRTVKVIKYLSNGEQYAILVQPVANRNLRYKVTSSNPVPVRVK